MLQDLTSSDQIHPVEVGKLATLELIKAHEVWYQIKCARISIRYMKNENVWCPWFPNMRGMVCVQAI